MKKLIVGMSLVALCVGVQAQTTNVVNFLSTAEVWGTSFNTNTDHSWSNVKLQYDTGVATATGIGISDRLYVQYNATTNLGVGIMGQFEGVGSPFGAIEGTIQYALINKYDFKAGVEADAGYDFNKENNTGSKVGAIEGDPGLFISKMMTANTYATMKFLVPVESVGKFQSQGLLYLGFGGTF